jgi:hypothetical protein
MERGIRGLYMTDPKHIPDAIWEEYGSAGLPPQEILSISKGRGFLPKMAAILSQLLGYLLLAAGIGICSGFLVSGWRPSASPWHLGFYCLSAAAVGAASALLFAPRHRLPGLAAGLLAGGGSLASLAGVLTQYPSLPFALVPVTAATGTVVGVAVFHFLKFVQDWFVRCRKTAERIRSGFCPELSRPAEEMPIAVIYSPPPEVPDPRVGALEEHLLYLCRQDKQVFHRLIDHARTKNPRLKRVELLRLAIQNWERDNR